MINLLPTSAQANVRLAKIKHLVLTVTTIVLVGYIILLAGMAGGSWYLAGRGTTVSAAVTSLTSQVNQLAEVEAVLRQQDDRLRLIREALSGRSAVAQAANLLNGAQVTSWKYQSSGVQDVSVVGPDAANLELYAQNLGDKFSLATIKSLSRKGQGQWQLDMSLMGGMP